MNKRVEHIPPLQKRSANKANIDLANANVIPEFPPTAVEELRTGQDVLVAKKAAEMALLQKKAKKSGALDGRKENARLLDALKERARDQLGIDRGAPTGERAVVENMENIRGRAIRNMVAPEKGRREEVQNQGKTHLPIGVRIADFFKNLFE